MTFDTDGTSHRSGSHTIHATASSLRISFARSNFPHLAFERGDSLRLLSRRAEPEAAIDLGLAHRFPGATRRGCRLCRGNPIEGLLSHRAAHDRAWAAWACGVRFVTLILAGYCLENLLPWGLGFRACVE